MSADEKARIIERFDRLIAFFEKNRFNLISGTMLLFSYILIRGLFEWTLFKPEGSSSIYVGLYNAYQAGFVFTLMFASGILVMALISRIKVRTITNVVLIGFVFSVMGPLLDRFIFGRVEGYEYVTLEDFSGAGMGLVFQLVLIGAFGGLYVAIKTESAKHAIATVAGLMGCMFFMGIIPTYIFKTLEAYNFGPDERQAAVAVILFALTVAVAAFLVYIADRRIPRALLNKGNPKFTFLFLAISFVGLAVAGNVFIIPEEGEAVTIAANDLPFAMLLVITVLFAGQCLFSLENGRTLRAGLRITKNIPTGQDVMTESRYRQYAGFCAIISMGFAGTLGPLSFLTVLIFVLVSLIFFKFANASSRVGISAGAGLAGVFMYLTGFLATTTKIRDSLLVVEPFEIRYPGSGAVTISAAAVAVGAAILVLVSMMWYFSERSPKKG